MRLRIPSDTSLGNQDRALGILLRSYSGHPHGYSNGPQGEVAPVPLQFQPRAVLERRRVFDRSIKGSFSSGSGSTNMRNDSDTPSSDLPSPPTPPDGSSLEVLISPTGTQVFVDNNEGVAAKEDSAHGTLYYDYSEQFEREEILEPEVNPIQAGLVQAIKTTQVEHGRSESRTAPARGMWRSGSTGFSNTAVPGMVELPASPVARRITRDMILQALEPASTTEGVDDSGDGANPPNIEQHPQHELVDNRHGSESVHPTTRKEGLDQRFSILSQADSSLINSSTLEFAVRYSIPIVTGGRLDSDAPLVLDKEPPLAPDMALTTEVDMSDLLAGYQHPESTHEKEGAPKRGDDQPVVDSVEDRDAESRSSHAHRSSDPDSFKSATDVLESEPSKHESVEDARANKSCPDAVVEKTPSVHEVDAHSFKTAQDAVTPGRSVSMPLAKTPMVEPTEASNSRPRSEAPLPPVPAVLRKSRVPVHDTSFPLASKFRASSKQSMKQSSVSMSGSSSTLSTSHQPPPVPPRESSTSQEAQRSMGVASWMLFKRWGKKPSKDDSSTKSRYSSRATLQEARPTNSVTSLQTSPGDTVKPPEKALCKESPVPTPKSNIVRDCTPPQVHNAGVADCLHQRSSCSPESDIAEPSSVVAEPQSVCSYDGGSTRSRVQSMPACVLKPADNHRDSKTTTYLTWHDGKSPTPEKPTASMGGPVLAQPASNDETTTNLRLSQYRYPGGLGNLPDLKEESHEDSSLNPSAGNSKNANFRFSDDVLAGVCAWVDDGAVLARRSSMGSYRRSARITALNQTRALPSMNFSQMNLLEKVDEVLQLRSSRSLDDLMVTPPEPRGGTPQRPVSAGDMREKYRSFCDRLDQLNTPKDATRTGITGFVTRRVRSPRLLAEIEQVTVPSVNGLTERLSELLPSLKAYYKGGDQGPYAAEEMIMEHAIEDIHEVGGPVQKRSSARLRPLPGSPEMIVIEDVLYTELTNKDKGIRVIVAPGDGSVGRAQSEFRASEKIDLTKTPFAELKAPPLSLTRSRTLTIGHANVRESVESGLTRRSLRSFTSTPTPTDTRPWNFDKNYPWASSTNNSIDISLPAPRAIRQSPRPGPSHLRNTLSDSSTVSTFTTPVGSPFGTDSDSSAYARQLHRFGILTRNGDQTHAVGERYPTSALTPPTAIFRDNYFGSEASDDEVESQVVRKGKFSLKKRFSSARNATVEDNTRPTNSKSLSTPNNPLELATSEPAHPSAPSIIQDSAGEARAFTSNRHTFRNAQGMPSVVYHRHRIIDHLKR
jgi:serine/arginine repetitive matrix protein 2